MHSVADQALEHGSEAWSGSLPDASPCVEHDHLMHERSFAVTCAKLRIDCSIALTVPIDSPSVGILKSRHFPTLYAFATLAVRLHWLGRCLPSVNCSHPAAGAARLLRVVLGLVEQTPVEVRDDQQRLGVG